MQTHTNTQIYIPHTHVCTRVVTNIFRTPIIVLCRLYNFRALCLTFDVATLSEIGFTEVYLCLICPLSRS